MREISYSSLRFKNAPFRRRIFWSALIGMAAAIFLGDQVTNLFAFAGATMHRGSLMDTTAFLIRFSIFSGTALFIHIIMLSSDAPHFQFSLMRLLVATILVALYFGANLIPELNNYEISKPVHESITLTKDYGWPLPLRSVRHYNSGQVEDIWHPTFCVFSAALLILAVLNVLLFKFPEREPESAAPGVFPKF